MGSIGVRLYIINWGSLMPVVITLIIPDEIAGRLQMICEQYGLDLPECISAMIYGVVTYGECAEEDREQERMVSAG